jgi:16S rRNA (guanine966-N2)-methyltransferase
MTAPARRSEVRLIGGQWKRSKLPVADAPGLRPTPDRVRETLFNWLQFEISGAHCLDAFAGSGALAFEALSRGASSVVMVERDAAQLRCLREAAAMLAAEHCSILSGDSRALLEKGLGALQAEGGFDVVFLDPPFHLGLVTPLCAVLVQQGCLHAGSFVYIETELDWAALALPPAFVLHRQTRAGLVNAFLTHYEPSPAA